jgi:hypothetical protein
MTRCQRSDSKRQGRRCQRNSIEGRNANGSHLVGPHGSGLSLTLYSQYTTFW